MNAQQEAVALWRFVESRGAKPTFRQVAGMLRSWGLRFRDEDLVAWLKPLRAVSRKQAGNKKHARGQQTGNERETASREKEVSLVAKSSEETIVSSSIAVTPSLRDSVTAPAEVFNFARPVVGQTKTRTPRQGRLPLNRDNEIAARALLDAAWHYLADHVPDLGLGVTQWRQRNKASALDLVSRGMTPDAVVEMLSVAHEHPDARFYRGVIMLGRLAERWHILSQIASGESCDRRPERRYQVL